MCLETNSQALNPLALLRSLSRESLLIRRCHQAPHFHIQFVCPCSRGHASMPIRAPYREMLSSIMTPSLPPQTFINFLHHSIRNHEAPVINRAMIAIVTKTKRFFPLPLSSLNFIPRKKLPGWGKRKPRRALWLRLSSYLQHRCTLGFMLTDLDSFSFLDLTIWKLDRLFRLLQCQFFNLKLQIFTKLCFQSMCFLMSSFEVFFELELRFTQQRIGRCLWTYIS